MPNPNFLDPTYITQVPDTSSSMARAPLVKASSTGQRGGPLVAPQQFVTADGRWCANQASYNGVGSSFPNQYWFHSDERLFLLDHWHHLTSRSLAMVRMSRKGFNPTKEKKTDMLTNAYKKTYMLTYTKLTCFVVTMAVQKRTSALAV